MARYNLCIALTVAVLLLVQLASPSLAHEEPPAERPKRSPQMPPMPSPGDFPKPPGMLMSRIARQAPAPPEEMPQQPPQPPMAEEPAGMRKIRRDVSRNGLVGYVGNRNNNNNNNDVNNRLQSTYSDGIRQRRAAKGTGGKMPNKAG